MRTVPRREAVTRGLRRAGASRRWWLLFSVGVALGLVGSSSAGAADGSAPSARRCDPARIHVAAQECLLGLTAPPGLAPAQAAREWGTRTSLPAAH
ncbi:hypothetical protein ACQEV2_36120 [Streptomyces sp. CA-251387]|uniref:hypothetical protein n=1 Tax=Streptomyces sp. CA-251387 TaxID=3240064 RepID=UPI003D9131D9